MNSVYCRIVLSLLLPLLLLLASTQAHAAVLREGTWPEEKPVTLAINGESRAVAIGKLAAEAGWSLVGQDLGDQVVHVQITDQPPAKALELLLSDGDYVVRRDGNLIYISKLRQSAPAVVDVTPDPAPGADKSKSEERKQPRKKGEDRVITGDGRVGPQEVVRDLFVWRSSVVVEGTVTGDVLLIGGSAQFLESAYVGGDLVAFGGSVDIANGAQVDGEVGVVAGSLHRGDQVEVNCTTCDDEPKTPQAALGAFLGKLLGRLAGVALVWVFGALLLALALRRVALVQAEILRRPWRCLGLGFVSFFGVLILMIALAVTLIGIPLALIGGMLAGLSAYVGFCVVLLAAGSALLGNRTQNAYKHLAVGCAAYFLVATVPILGDVVCAAVILTGLGALVATRGAGYVPWGTAKEETPAVNDAPSA